MTIEEALTAHLMAQPALTALIGRRYFYDDAALGTKKPYVIAQCISNIPVNTHEGETNSGMPNYQFIAYANTREEARAVANQTKAAVENLPGDYNGISVKSVNILNDKPGTLENAGGAIRVPFVLLEYTINYLKG